MYLNENRLYYAASSTSAPTVPSTFWRVASNNAHFAPPVLPVPHSIRIVSKHLGGTMAAAYQPADIATQHPVARGIRVVLACNNEISHTEMRRQIHFHPEMSVVGEAYDGETLRGLLDEFLPEVVIASPNLQPSRNPDAVFPLVAVVGGDSLGEARAAFLRVHSTASEISTALQSLRIAVLEAKWQDVMHMLRATRSVARPGPTYLDELEVSASEGVLQLPLTRVHSIVAAKNYVRLETESGVYQARSPMADLHARLDPSVFVRVHRSAIVNRREIRSLLEREGAPVAVILRNGRRIPIGTTYRQAASAAFGKLASRD